MYSVILNVIFDSLNCEMSSCDIPVTMSPNNRKVIVAIDDSDYAEYAFDCKYSSQMVYMYI